MFEDGEMRTVGAIVKAILHLASFLVWNVIRPLFLTLQRRGAGEKDVFSPAPLLWWVRKRGRMTFQTTSFLHILTDASTLTWMTSLEIRKQKQPQTFDRGASRTKYASAQVNKREKKSVAIPLWVDGEARGFIQCCNKDEYSLLYLIHASVWSVCPNNSLVPIGSIHTRVGWYVWANLHVNRAGIFLSSCINTGKQTNHPSRRTFWIVCLVRRIVLKEIQTDHPNRVSQARAVAGVIALCAKQFALTNTSFHKSYWYRS